MSLTLCSFSIGLPTEGLPDTTVTIAAVRDQLYGMWLGCHFQPTMISFVFWPVYMGDSTDLPDGKPQIPTEPLKNVTEEKRGRAIDKNKKILHHMNAK